MKVVKNINNNISLCLDSRGKEVIVFGKGVGFKKPPYDLSLNEIQRTFYDIDENYLSILKTLDEEIIEISSEIIDYARIKLDLNCSDNIIFTLADHIQFAIKREKDGIQIKLPLYYEVYRLYPKEIKIGTFALSLIENELNIKLPKDESAAIALHLINYGMTSNKKTEKNDSMIETIVKIIEEKMEMKINRKDASYIRFVIHVYYLLERIDDNKATNTDNKSLFLSVKKEYPKIYECVLDICKKIGLKLNEEEQLYLILHVNRLCTHEGCYR